ncbi:MAG: hypothetical protein IPJ40_11350 [Saprospirales bacterium]|nr:hypothetical protein [Saprospirales bacterium]
MRIVFRTALFLSLLFSAVVQAQVSSVEFGKNRIQYHQDYEEWSQYESQNFTTYWYGESRFIGQAVVQMAEYDFASIERILEHRMNDKIEIIVYTDLTDVKQSNIGSEEIFMNAGGQTKIVGNKMFVYFNGDHNDLRRQIREGIASVYLNSMLFGSNLQEVVQNAVLLNLPVWFSDGLVAYVGEEWSTELDGQLRDRFNNGEIKDFTSFAEKNPRLAGHSLWYFISQQFGKSTVANLIYLTRINRSVESGFLYVLGSSFTKTTESWQSYFSQRYKGELRTTDSLAMEPLPIKNRRNLPYTQAKISPDGQRIAYATNEIGKVKVYIYELETGSKKLILKSGSRNPFQDPDYNYPLLAWNPNNLELAVLYERRDVPKLMLYSRSTNEKVVEDLSTQYQRVYSMDYLNSTDLVLAAAVRGFSDIFIYFTKNRQTQRITQDFWDDLDARAVKLGNRRGIIFASNRQDSLFVTERLDTILPLQSFDLFYYDLDSRSNELVRLTRTPNANERQPLGVDTTYFSYLGDESGIMNRYMGYLEDYIHHYDRIVLLDDGTEITFHADSALTTKLDSAAIAQIDSSWLEPFWKKRAITYPASNLNLNIQAQHAAPMANKLLLSQVQAHKNMLFTGTLGAPASDSIQLYPSLFREKQRTALERQKIPTTAPQPPPSPILEEKKPGPLEPTPPVKEATQDTSKVDIDNYLFQSEFDDDELPSVLVVEEPAPTAPLQRPVQPSVFGQRKATEEVLVFNPSRIIPYRLKFRTDFVTTQLDNAPLFDGLNSYAGTPVDFGFLPPGILLKANFKDLFEDYEMEGGMRIPTTFNGAEYFLVFKNKKKHIDKQYAVYRRALRFPGEARVATPIQPRTENTTFLALTQWRYPIDIFTSLRATATYRMDNTTQLATDTFSLQTPSLRENRIGLRMEYVFDNTYDVAINMKDGIRYKVFAEVVKRFDIELGDQFSANFAKGFMGVVGLDARYYQRLLKHSVFAVRLAGATSFGSERILYYIGGVDSWLFPRFDNNIPTPTTGNFAYQTVAPNLRGFQMNIRNGNSYLLSNAELRIAPFRYLSKNLRSNFLRNFQIAGFFDVGTAWQGRTPFTDENPLNTKIIPDPLPPGTPIFVKVKYFRDPVVVGYGVGIRTLLFGYFLRVDYGWGIETRQVQKPRLYFALGTDF